MTDGSHSAVKFLGQGISRCESSISRTHFTFSKDTSVENAQIFSVDAHLPVSDEDLTEYKSISFSCLFLCLRPPHLPFPTLDPSDRSVDETLTGLEGLV